MISEDTLSRILELLEPEDRIPYEGRYTVSHTIYGCSSLSRGGTYCDLVNNNELTKTINDEKLKGVYEHTDYPGVFSIIFNPEKMDERSAEVLISFLEDVNSNARSSVPCIDENLASELEFEDLETEIRATLDDYAWQLETSFSEEVVNKVVGRISACSLYIVECGPSIFIETRDFEDVLKEVCPKLNKEQSVLFFSYFPSIITSHSSCANKRTEEFND